MLYLSNIREAREAQKLRLTTLSRQLRVHRDTIQRLETGKEIDQLTDIARLLGFNICLLTDQEVEILAQFNAILAKNGQKVAK
jgi:predicted transcriptional regulator